MSSLRDLTHRLSGTVAERLSDPELIVNRAIAFYGEREGLRHILELIERHNSSPDLRESDGSSHTEGFLAGVGKVQLSTWPREYFADCEPEYLAVGYAGAE